MTISEMARAHDTAGRRDLSVTTVIAGLAALAAALHVFTPFNHDEAWLLEGAGRLLDGGHLGVDIVDMNPPPVWWLSIVPVWLGRQIGARSDIAATMFTASMAVLSLGAVDRLITPTSVVGLARRQLLLIAAILLLFVPGYDFGQREHWAVLLIVPYVVVRSRRINGATVSLAASCAIGFAACLGFCLKPYFLLVPIGLEIWLLAWTRSAFAWVAPETIALSLTGVALAVLTIVFVPTYFGREVPNALLGYWAYNGTLHDVLYTAAVLLVPAVALTLLGYSTRLRDEPLPALAQAFAIAGVASLVAALMQMKPWPYHFLPSVLFFDLSAAVLLVTGTPRTGTHAIRLAALAVLIAMGFSASAAEVVRKLEGDVTAARVGELAAVFRANPGPNRTVAGFITSPRDVFPAVIASKTKWAAPFCCSYLLAAATRSDEAPVTSRAAIESAGLNQAKTALSSMRAKNPGVIVIDAGDDMLGFAGRKFDYVEWLEAHTDFADILRHYREIDPVGPLRVFVRE